MSNLNCRWASADELVRITEPAPEPEPATRYGMFPALALSLASTGAAKRKALKVPVAPATTLEPMEEPLAGNAADAVNLAPGSLGGDPGAAHDRDEGVPEVAPEAAIEEPSYAWAAMISPPRSPLIGTEKVFALMGPREADEGEARQVDISQADNFHAQLSSPSKWRWQRLGGDIVLLGSGVTQWASLRERLLDSR